MNKICTKCKQNKPLTSFHIKKTGAQGRKAICKVCCSLWHKSDYHVEENKIKRLTRQRKPSYLLSQRASMLKAKYGITLADYDLMLKKQFNKCAVCFADKPGGRSSTYFHIDHCHTTGKVRGLLCFKCNSVIGLLNDSPSLAQDVQNYLLKHGQVKSIDDYSPESN